MTEGCNQTWEEREVGKCMKLISGFPFPSSAFSKSDGTPLIRIRDILDSKIETYFTGRFSPQYVVQKGDVLVGMDGDFNIRRWNNREALLNQRILKIDTYDQSELDINFLYYWLQPFLKHINDVTAATTVKHLSVNDLTKARAKLPIVGVQRKIGRILRAVDEAIEKTEALIEKYEQIKAGMMHDLFTRGLTADGKLRPPREEAPDLYQETPIGWIPKEWTPKPLASLSNVVRGSTPRPSKDPRYFDGSHVPWITVGELSKEDWPFLNDTETMLTALGSQFSRHLGKGTLVISNSGFGCGVPKILNIDGCANDGVAAFLDFSEECDLMFVYYYLYGQIETLRTKVARGNDQPNLNTDMLGEFCIPVPEKSEQSAVSERLWRAQIRLQKEKAYRDKLDVQKSGLMHDLLTGKTPVKTEETEMVGV